MKKLKYEDITNEQWEIYRAVEKSCSTEDLKDTLQNYYNTNIDTLENDTIESILEQYEDNITEDSNWRDLLRSAINSNLKI